MNWFKDIFKQQTPATLHNEQAISLTAESSAKIDHLSDALGQAMLQIGSPKDEKALSLITDSSIRLDRLSETLGRVVSLPIPVQTFPTTDDFQWEREKQSAANLADGLFRGYEKEFMNRLAVAPEAVRSNTDCFFTAINQASTATGEMRKQSLQKAMDQLLACSPKKILAEFQKCSLEAGWSYVHIYNCVIDKLAETFPRCRAGIYTSRLKYSDVIQIAEEILTTLRACSTLMDDLQRRYDMLEALQKDIEADLETPESDKIWSAIKNTYTDTASFGNKDIGSIKLFKRLTGIVAEIGTTFGNATAAPTLQIQGQMQRTQRILVFFSTVEMFRNGWIEWKKATDTIIIPNLNVMFALKRDFFKNQVVCLCDLVTYNGYSLKGLTEKLMQMCE